MSYEEQLGLAAPHQTHSAVTHNTSVCSCECASCFYTNLLQIRSNLTFQADKGKVLSIFDDPNSLIYY